MIRDTLDRLRSTRVGKKSKYDSAEHEEMAERYEKKKRFHEATKKPKEESLKEKAIRKVMAKGKDLAEKSKRQAIEELKSKNSKPKSKTKTKTKSRPRSNEVTTAYSTSNHNFGFGFDMFNPQQTAERQPEKEVDWSKLYDFRWNTESPNKKKKDNSSDMWDFRGFYQ